MSQFARNNPDLPLMHSIYPDKPRKYAADPLNTHTMKPTNTSTERAAGHTALRDALIVALEATKDDEGMWVDRNGDYVEALNDTRAGEERFKVVRYGKKGWAVMDRLTLIYRDVFESKQDAEAICIGLRSIRMLAQP